MTNRHHFPCPGGCGELADECRCAAPNPFGSMRIELEPDFEGWQDIQFNTSEPEPDFEGAP